MSDLNFDQLMKAGYIELVRLAKALGVDYRGLHKNELARVIVRWYKKHPQPKRRRR